MEQNISPLLHPDVLLPDQYWETVSRGQTFEPEKKLMLAVLEDAINNYKKHLCKENLRYAEAEDWLLDKNSDPLFSFENICDVLGLNSEQIRQKLLRWRKEASLRNATVFTARKITNRARTQSFNRPIWGHRSKERPSTVV